MSMRRQPINTKQFLHIYGRGVRKSDIYIEEKEYFRFILRMLLYQRFDANLKLTKGNADRILNSDMNKLRKIKGKRCVYVHAYCLMPNHYHILLSTNNHEKLALYMKRLLASHANFFNKKHDCKGRVFEREYHINIIENQAEMSTVLNYIHRNPHDLVNNDFDEVIHYPFSSLYDYCFKSNLFKFLKITPVLKYIGIKKPDYRFYFKGYFDSKSK
jgi:REP element-mobilizing transposase RayT